ncbi:MAG: glycosyltransferase family 4 protein [Eubacteriales bacterium]
MKIGVFTDSYFPYTSGVVHSIDTFNQELVALGHEVFIFAPSYPNIQDDQENVFRFSSLPAPTNRDFTLAFPFSFHLENILEKWQPEIIHAHSPFILGHVGSSCARRLRIPLVFTFHTLYDEYVHYFPIARKITKNVVRSISRNFCNRSNVVIVPTEVVREHLRQMGVSTPIKKIPTGIKLSEFSNLDRFWLKKNYGIPERSKVLLFVGRLGQEKNIYFLLECFEKVFAELPGTFLVLVGSGPEEEELKNLTIDRGISNNIIFAGKKDRSEMARHYAGSDLFVFTSLTETQGLVIAEAKAAGIPSVAVKANGVCEMVDDGEDGYLTDLDQDSFIEKVVLLLKDDELRKRFSEKAKENVKKISSRRCALELIDSYQEILQAEGVKKYLVNGDK